LKLLLDEMYPPRIAAELRKRGHDVAAVAEQPELRAMDDEGLLNRATANGRAVVTEDFDFIEIANVYALEARSYHGVILASSSTFPRTERGIGALIRALEAYLNSHLHDRTVAAGVQWLTPVR
jgi:predicted nuclease of predicted toxin-antitoxin system